MKTEIMTLHKRENISEIFIDVCLKVWHVSKKISVSCRDDSIDNVASRRYCNHEL